MRTIQGWLLSHLLDWGQFLTAAIASDLPWNKLPLRRSRSCLGEGQIFYTTALFPWLANCSGIDQQTWEQKTIELFPQWIAQQNLNFPGKTIGLEPVRIIEGLGLEIGISEIVLGQNLQEWIELTPETRLDWKALSPGKTSTGETLSLELVSDRPKLLLHVCALSYTADRCDQLGELARCQNWWSPPNISPWNSCPWDISLKRILAQDKTARSLLELWLDMTYALEEKPRRLVTGLPRLRQAFETFDRAHAFGGLAHTLDRASLECYGGLITATGALLRQIEYLIRVGERMSCSKPTRKLIVH